MANEAGAGAGADASAAGAAGSADAGAVGGTQGGATGAQGGADASKGADYWQTEAKNAFAKRDAEAAQRKAAETEREALRARIAELEKAKPTGQENAQRVEGNAAGASTFDSKVVEATAGTAGSAAAKAELAAYIAAQNRVRLEDTVTATFKAVGGKYDDLLAPKLEQAIKEGKLSVDQAGRVQGHEAFIAGLRTTHPILFGDPPPGAIPGGAGAPALNELRKANPDGRRGSLAQGPVFTEAQRKNAEQALRKK